jgi:hypothetical protein
MDLNVNPFPPFRIAPLGAFISNLAIRRMAIRTEAILSIPKISTQTDVGLTPELSRVVRNVKDVSVRSWHFAKGSSPSHSISVLNPISI